MGQSEGSSVSVWLFASVGNHRRVCEHTWAVKGGFEDYLIKLQIEPSGNCTLPLGHLPHEMVLRYKLCLNEAASILADPISCQIGQDKVLIACQKLYFSAPGKQLTTLVYH